MKNDILLMKIVVDFLSQLDNSQIEDLLNKRARLKLEVTAKNKAAITNEGSISEVCNSLEQKTSREDACSYLYTLNLNKTTLKLLVKHYNIPLASKATNTQMTDAIVEAVIGSKLRYDALYNTDFSKSYNFTPTIEEAVDFYRRPLAMPMFIRVCVLRTWYKSCNYTRK